MKALIDGDLVAFRCAASAEGESEGWIACARSDNFIDEILTAVKADECTIYLSCSNNFRYLVYPEYKGNRKDNYRPKWEKETKEYLQRVHSAVVFNGAEADDALGAFSTDDTIIVTNDKDLKQIKGHHYDPVKKILFDVSPKEADYWFYYQCLIGDTVDNIKGVPGIGPKKATAILSSCTNEQEMRDAVKDLYSCDEEWLMNAKCLYIWRKPNDSYDGQLLSGVD